MAQSTTVLKIKTDLRISHSQLDDELSDEIDSCKADLVVCGIVNPQENDPLILAAIKLWCRAGFTDDTNKATAYMERYDKHKACLMMAEGYGGGPHED